MAAAKPNPIQWVSLEEAFEPQIKVRALLSISGWVGPKKHGKRWEIRAGDVGYLDAEKAREFQAKKYVSVLEGNVEPVSAEELAEMTKHDAVIGLGRER